MKKTILSLMLLAMACPLAAQISPTVSVQGTNATLRWASTPGERYFVHYRRAFHPDSGLQWKLIGTNILATGTETTFQHTGGVPRVPAGVGGGGGGGGSSPPVLLSATSPTTDPTQDKDDKVKAKDNALPAFPTLPDEKALEKWLKELLKEYERQQREGGGVQVFTALMASTLTAEQATNNSMGYYAVSRATDDTDGDGLPDWWEATYGLQLLVNDAAADPDGDQASNLAEYTYGTNPTNSASKPMPTVTFTSPVNTNTYLPVVQITGSINLNLQTLSYSVTNAAGVLAGMAGFTTARTVTPGPGFTNSPARYTNAFQCFDVPLTNGLNTVGLRFTDAYGLIHVTNVTFMVNFAASPAAPLASQVWPAQGTQLGGDAFTLRGRLDNPTAIVTAYILNNGALQEYGGLVERDGSFWMENLPLPSTNHISVVFADAGGKSRTNIIYVYRAPVSVTLATPVDTDLWKTHVNLQGTVNNTNYSVWVNSVRATVSNGQWFATQVPVNAGGVASFAIRAIPNSENGGAGSGPTLMTGSAAGGLYSPPTGNPNAVNAADVTFDFDKPPRIVVASYMRRYQYDDQRPDWGQTNRSTLDWARNGAGYSGTATSYWQMKYPDLASLAGWESNYVTYPYPGTNGSGTATGVRLSSGPFTQTYAALPPTIPWEQAAINLRSSDRALSEKAQTTLQLMTGGRAVPGAFNAFLFDVPVSVTDAYGAAVTILPSDVQFLGGTLDTNYVAGRLSIPANATVDVTPIVQLAQATGSGGGRATHPVVASASVVRPVFGPTYVSGVQHSSQGPLHLGYGTVRIDYQLTGHGGRTWRHSEQILGTPYYIFTLTNAFSSLATRYSLLWNGTVPDGPAGPQVRNTRRYVDPQTPELAAFVTTADTGNQIIGSGKLGVVKVAAKAVVARQTFGDAAHLATIAGHLSTARYTVTQDQDLSLTSVTNNLPLGLVWYSISHGRSDFGDFLGLKIKDNQTLAATNMPRTFNYTLAFLNKCNSANDGAGNVTALGNKFGPDCAIVGWTGKVVESIAIEAARRFFDHLSSGKTVDDAVLKTKDEMPNKIAYLGNDGESKFVRDALIVVRGGGVIIDLRP